MNEYLHFFFLIPCYYLFQKFWSHFVIVIIGIYEFYYKNNYINHNLMIITITGYVIGDYI